jgi:Uncharacterized NAD(FAD)-dependent dehydrogenases
MSKKIVIIGGVAGGASAAARLRRLDETAEIIMFERGGDISFANCGMPYYIGGVIPERDNLLLQTPASLRARFNIDVRVFSEVTAIDAQSKCVDVTAADGSYKQAYDVLVLAPGAAAIRPPFPGADLPGVFTLRNMADCDNIKNAVTAAQSKCAVVVGGGFIGIEMMENLKHLGLEVTVVEQAAQVLQPLDPDMAQFIHAHIRENGAKLFLGIGLSSIAVGEASALNCILSDGTILPADVVILAIGVKPDTAIAATCGIERTERGAIVVDDAMRTSVPDIYAVGDAVSIKDFVTGRPAVIPLAGPANRQGRIAAGNIAGRDFTYRGTLGSSICKVFRLTAASTGNNEKQLQAAGVTYDKVYLHAAAHASYYPGAKMLHTKLLFCPESGTVLGAQLIGEEGADKRTDVVATAIYAGLTVEDLENLELSYAPPFSSAKDPVNLAGFIASNVRRGDLKQFFTADIFAFDARQDMLVDIRTAAEYAQGSIPNAINIPLDEIRSRLDEFPKGKRIRIFCRVGLRGYVGCRILSQHGYDVSNLSGGYLSWDEG